MKRNVKVIVCDDYVIRDKQEVQKVLDRLSKIISGSYVRQMKEGVAV